jgi:DNA-binding beta-propeller fold protein YncE
VAGAQPSHDQATGAVFVETDSAHNQVVSYARAAGGTLRPAGTYGTLGAGGILDGSVVDHTASEGAVALDEVHHLLFAVDAGSDTVTVFAVHGDRLTRVQVVRSGGSFPVSVVAGGGAVVVLNARDGGSVQSYAEIAGRLVPTGHRPLGLDESATPEFTHTPGQVAVTPDGHDLVVTTKASTNAVEMFPIGVLGLLGKPSVTTLPGCRAVRRLV